MNGSSRKDWIYKALAVGEFVIGLSTFLSSWIVYGLPIYESFGISVGIVFVLFLVIETASKFTLHSRFLAPIRKRLLYALSCVVIDKWTLILEMKEQDGFLNAEVTNEFYGKVNFGYAQWLTLGIWAGQEQAKEKDFKVRVFDVIRQNYQDSEFLFNESRLKRIRIRFRNILKRGERFHFRVQYELKKTFYLDKEDFYDFETVHHEKEVKMKVTFPDTVRIEYAREEIITEHGDIWEEHEKAKTVDSQTIEWNVHEALYGNHHKLYWKITRKKLE